MKHLLLSLENALKAENHYAALALALALPDICGWLQDPKSGSKARCIFWFEKYLQSKYTLPATQSQPERIFLTGSDFYALRCAYLHEGRDDITEQRAQEVLSGFQFTVPPPGWQVHRNRMNDTLQLQVDIFCREVINAVNQFLVDSIADPPTLERMTQLLLIRDINGQPLRSEA